MDTVQIDLATLDKVDKAAGGGHDYLHTFAQRAYLRLYGRTAIDRKYFDTVKVTGKVGHIAGYLQAQLSCGGND